MKSAILFKPNEYVLDTGKDIAVLKIKGQRFGPPSKRFSFFQKGLKIKGAKIVLKQKNKEIEYEIERINHLPSFNQVRIHTKTLLYPGNYEIELRFISSNLDKINSQDIEPCQIFPVSDKSENPHQMLKTI